MKPSYLIDKHRGETPLQATQRLRALHPDLQTVPLTYAGRLDPMATGLLLILAGEECKKKDDYLGLKKTYQATVTLGLNTDSSDLLGIPMLIRTTPIDEATIYSAVNALKGTLELAIPPYASVMVDGKPSHYWAQLGIKKEQPIRTSTIFSIKEIAVNNISLADLVEEAVELTESVHGNFRQSEIADAWKTIEKENPGLKLTQVSFCVEVSSGTYIRAIAQHLGTILKCGGHLSRLRRTQIGSLSLH